MTEIQNLADAQIGDVLEIGANGKETRHTVIDRQAVTGFVSVYLDRPLDGVADGFSYGLSNGYLPMFQKVGALRILRPEPPFSVEFEGVAGEPVRNNEFILVFDSPSTLKRYAGKKLRVRIDEVRE